MNRIFFILFLVQFSYSQAQEPWLYENNFDRGFQILESYDGGVIILAVAQGQSGTGKLIKLNKMGEILWEHTFEEADEGVYPMAMVEDENGDLIIAGQTFQYENTGDAFVMRLDACGELLWFKNVGAENEHDYISHIVLDKNGTVATMHMISPNEQRFTLKKTDALGNVLWSNNLLVENIWGGDTDGLSICSDGGYVLAGSVYAPPYFDQSSTGGYLRGIVIKTDSLGALEWGNIYRWEEDNADTIFMSMASGVAELRNGHFSVISADRNDANMPPLMYELNENGDLLWHKNIAKPDTFYTNSKSVLLPDSTIIVGISVALPGDILNAHLELYKMDLQGNKLAEFVDETDLSVLGDLRLSPDSSYLYSLPGSTPNGIYALKLNPYTMELDSFALEDNAAYDYYCPEGVVNQNFFFPELDIENIDSQEKQQLSIAPNPAKNYTYIYFDISNFNRSAKIEIHSMQGQLVNSTSILARTGCLYEDLSPYTSGIYVVSLIMDNQLIESRKMIVE